MQTAAKYEVLSIPTMILFKDGQMVERIVGFMPKPALMKKIEPHLKPGLRVYQVKMYDQTVPFYIGRTTKLVDYGDEFEMGLLAEPGSHIERWWEFFAEWERPGEALAIMQPDIYAKFRALDLPMQVLHEDPRRVLVRKP